MFEYLKLLKIPADKAFLTLLIVALCEQTIFIYPVVVIRHIGPLEVFSYFILPLTYFILAIASLQHSNTKWFRNQDLLIFAFFFTAIVFSYLIYPENGKYLSEGIKNDILLCIPFFLFGIAIKPNQLTMDTLGKWCCVGVILTAFYRLRFQQTSQTGDINDEMDASYTLLLSTLIVINYAFSSKKILPILCSLIGIVYTLAMGSRGPLIIILSFIFACLFVHFKLKKWLKVLLITIVLVFAITFLSSNAYLSILEFCSEFFGGLGFSTRIFDLALAEEMIEHTSGRDDIYVDLLHRLQDRPIAGYGVYGEWQFGYASAHNMYLETVFHYGWPLGICILLTYIVTVVKAFVVSKNKYAIQLMALLSCFVFVRGVFGGLLLTFGVFFLWGLALREIRVSKNNPLEDEFILKY